MNKGKANAALSATGIIVLVLAVAGSIVVFWQTGRLKQAKEELTVRRAALNAAYSMDPFPNTQNVEMVRHNRDELNREVLALSKSMGAGQVEPDADKVPLEWLNLLKGMQRTLLARAKAAETVCDKDFAFGFSKYNEGTPPQDVRHVPRLSQQVKIVEALCTVLFDVKVDELIAVDRDEFEGGAPSLGPPASGAQDAAADIIMTERVNLEFRARELAFLNAMNRFVSNSMFIVVRDVRVEGESGAGFDSMRSEDAETLTNSSVVYADRVLVSGPGKETPAKIRLELDVYRFLLKEARKLE